MAKDKFGEAVFELEVNNKAFETDLRGAEAVTRRSSEKMRHSLERIPKAANKATVSINKASLAAGGLGAAGAAAGSPVAALAGQMVSLAASAGPVSVALAGVVAIIGLVAAAFRKAKEEQADFLRRFEEFQARQSEIRARDSAAVDAEIKEQRALFKARELAQRSLNIMRRGGSQTSLIEDPVLRRIAREVELHAELVRSQDAARLKTDAANARRIADLKTIENSERALLTLAKEDRFARATGAAPARTKEEAYRAAVAQARNLRIAAKVEQLRLRGIREALRFKQITAREAIILSRLQSGGGQQQGGNVGGGISASFFRGGRVGAGVVSASPEVKTNIILEKILKETITDRQATELLSRDIKQLNQMNP